MDDLELRILGPVEVRWGGQVVMLTGARQRDLVTCLGVRANRVVLVERLIALLWGDDPPDAARNTLHTLVRRVRRQLGEPAASALETHPGGYLLRLSADGLDAHRFEQLLREGRRRLAAGAPTAAIPALEAALELWRGTALADVTAPELVRVERPRLAELRTQAVEELVEARLASGEHADLIGELSATVAANPLRERPYGQLMVALYRCGRQSESLAIYHQLRQQLVDQLGVEPGPELQRLHQAVLRADPALQPAHTTAAVVHHPPPPQPVPAQLPAEMAGFTGRQELLSALRQLAEAPQRPGVVALVGTAGVGKTAAALRWAHQLRERFSDGQLYLDLQGFSAPPAVPAADALGRFLRALGAPPEQVPADALEAAAEFRTRLADRQVLVVLDNALDADQVRPLLPGGAGCLTVVTSRDRLDPLVAQEGAARFRLEPLPAPESTELLARALGQDRVREEPDAAAELAEACAHLPLALRIAAAHLTARTGSIDDYLKRLRATRAQGEPTMVEDGPVRAAFELSYAVLGAPAQRMFQLLGCLPAHDVSVPAAAALAGVTAHQAAALLEELAGAHLLVELAPERYGCHDLLQAYAGQLAEQLDPPQRATAVHAVLDWYLAAAEAGADLVDPHRVRPPDSTALPDDAVPAWPQPPDALEWLDAERHNLVRIAEHAAGLAAYPIWRLATALCVGMPMRGNLAELTAVCDAALAAAQAHGAAGAQACAQLALGDAYFRRRRHRQAVAHYRSAVRLAAEVGWDEGLAHALVNEGDAQQQLGHLEEAEPVYRLALTACERLDAPHLTARLLTNLANGRYEQGDPAAATELLTRALALVHGTAARRTQVVVLLNLGWMLREQGRQEQAQSRLTQALTLAQQLGNRVREAEAMRLLAEVHRDQGRLAPARDLATAALELARRAGSRADQAAALHTLGAIRAHDGDPRQALVHHREALAVVADLAVPHVVTKVHLGLAEAYRALGRADQATIHASQALTLARTNGYRQLAQRAAALLDPDHAPHLRRTAGTVNEPVAARTGTPPTRPRR